MQAQAHKAEPLPGLPDEVHPQEDLQKRQ